MLCKLIEGIKTTFPELAKQRDFVKEVVNNCMNQGLVEPTVKLELLDLSTIFPNADKCFRQMFTENGICYSWWGIKVKGGASIHGLEKIIFNTIEGTHLENLWVEITPSSANENKMIALLRMSIHSDLF